MNSPSDTQLQQVETAAALLPVEARSRFFRSIVNRLRDLEQRTDNDIASAIQLVLSCHGIAAPFRRHSHNYIRRRRF